MLVRISFEPEYTQKYYIRYIFDVTCFFIINMILMNVIFGLIIESFATLRDQKHKMEEDQANVCFICSLHRQHVRNGSNRSLTRQH